MSTCILENLRKSLFFKNETQSQEYLPEKKRAFITSPLIAAFLDECACCGRFGGAEVAYRRRLARLRLYCRRLARVRLYFHLCHDVSIKNKIGKTRCRSDRHTRVQKTCTTLVRSHITPTQSLMTVVVAQI